VSFSIVWSMAVALASDRIHEYDADDNDENHFNKDDDCGMSGVGPVTMGPAFSMCVVAGGLAAVQVLLFAMLRSALRAAKRREGYTQIV
jgi:hypothetical protein